MKENILNHTPIFDLVEKIDDREIGFNPVGINAPNWITIIVEKEGNFLMTKQLRYGLMHECEEFCSGQVDGEELPVETARRELLEETGYSVSIKSIRCLGNFASNPAFMNNRMYYFYVNLDNCKYTLGDTSFDEHENIISYWKNKNEVVSDCMKNHDSVFMPTGLLLLKMSGLSKGFME